MENTDQKSASGAIRNNDDAFVRLVDRYLDSIYGFVFRFVGDKEAAKDIVQETFLKAWKHADRFSSGSNEKAFLFTIAKNTAFDWLKKRKSIPFSWLAHKDEEGNNLEFDTISESPLPDEMVDREETVRKLDEALYRLSEPDRAILVLIYREDFSMKEAADIMGEPYNTVKSRHQRALRRLKNILLENGLAPKTDADSL